jgi:hypothetical protein
MKKMITLFLFAGLLSNSMVSAIMSPRRLWQCRPTNQNPIPSCSAAERATSKKWLVGGTATVIGSILAALGIAAGVAEVRREQAAAQQKPLSESERMIKAREQVKEAKLELELADIRTKLFNARYDLEMARQKMNQVPEDKKAELQATITATEQQINQLIEAEKDALEALSK